MRVRLRGGQMLSVQTGEHWKEETPVSIAIRSERVQVADSTQSDNVVAARIASSIYLGSKWQHTVETEAGSLKVETLDPVRDSMVRLYLPPSALILLKRSA